MQPIKITVHGSGSGICALTGKDGDGLTVTFEDQTVVNSFLSWRSFKQLLALKSKQFEKPKVLPGNGSPAPVAMAK
ncbi:MAG: hypothetical protein ACK4RK_19105 [Gemmataceae bacterium]